jgi:hypothetical protein
MRQPLFTSVLCALLASASCSTALAQTPRNTQAQLSKRVQVPEQVAVLLRPILDELQKYRVGNGVNRHTVDERFYALTKRKGSFADEALVVLMCFEVMGESQEDADAVIGRGRKMLPFVEKYRLGDPQIPGRAYPNTMLKSASHKAEDFQGAIKAIKHGWRGTWDNPEG